MYKSVNINPFYPYNCACKCKSEKEHWELALKERAKKE